MHPRWIVNKLVSYHGILRHRSLRFCWFTYLNQQFIHLIHTCWFLIHHHSTIQYYLLWSINYSCTDRKTILESKICILMTSSRSNFCSILCVIMIHEFRRCEILRLRHRVYNTFSTNHFSSGEGAKVRKRTI
jgi:hypothetical protein